MNKFKKNDGVIITGKDRGKTAKVLQVIPETHQVVIEKINMVKRHTKPSQTSAGGIVEMEKPLDWSNVMLICKYCKKPAKVAYVDIEGHKARKCKSCGEIIDKK
jgi:large subunit ribosomal protein L24